MPAKYLITVPPGAYVGQGNVGFVEVGKIFTAPSDNYVPSRTFMPVNEEALEALRKVYADRKAHFESRLADAQKDGDKELLRQWREQLRVLADEAKKHLILVEIPVAKPAVEEGLSLKQLAELNLGVQENRSTPAKAEEPKAAGKRAADR